VRAVGLVVIRVVVILSAAKDLASHLAPSSPRAAARHASALLVLLSASLAFAQAIPTPRAVVAKDDAEDRKGTNLSVTWQTPQGPPPAGMQLAGFRIHVEEGKEKAKVTDALADPEATEAGVSDLKPWRDYRVGVSAFYLSTGTQFAPDDTVPTALPLAATESAIAYSAPVRPRGTWFKNELMNVLVIGLLITAIVVLTIMLARRRDMYVRPITGLQAVDDAIGRATEMGRPILYVAGLASIGDIATIAAILIMGHLVRRTAAYETPILVPCNEPLVMAIQREIAHEAYLEAGKPDAYDPENIFYVTDSQFGYVAAVDGIMIRQKPAANFYMGSFAAESLILAETGAASGAIQIAGTDSDTQLPFFITSCDYTLMGEELYAASAYLSRDPILLAQLKGQDLGKIAISAVLLIGTVLLTFWPYGIGEWFLGLVQAK